MRLGWIAAACAATFACCLAQAAAKTLHVDIENVAYGAMPKDARVGDMVEWRNRDFVAHTATARDGSFDAVIAPGQSARTTLRRAGVVAVYCRYHPNMTGELAVGP
jgi:plastocyanin